MDGDKETRSGRAGVALAKSIIEMVHLMYNNDTAWNFYCGLTNTLSDETDRRLKEE